MDEVRQAKKMDWKQRREETRRMLMRERVAAWREIQGSREPKPRSNHTRSSEWELRDPHLKGDWVTAHPLRDVSESRRARPRSSRGSTPTSARSHRSNRLVDDLSSKYGLTVEEKRQMHLPQ